MTSQRRSIRRLPDPDRQLHKDLVGLRAKSSEGQTGPG